MAGKCNTATAMPAAKAYNELHVARKILRLVQQRKKKTMDESDEASMERVHRSVIRSNGFVARCARAHPGSLDNRLLHVVGTIANNIGDFT